MASGVLVLIRAAALPSCAGPEPQQPALGRRVTLSRWPQGKSRPLLGYRGHRVTQKQGSHGWDVTAGPTPSTCPVLPKMWGRGPGSPLLGMFRDSKRDGPGPARAAAASRGVPRGLLAPGVQVRANGPPSVPLAPGERRRGVPRGPRAEGRRSPRTCADAVRLVPQGAEVAVRAVGARGALVAEVALARPVPLPAAVPAALSVPAARPLGAAPARCGDRSPPVRVCPGRTCASLARPHDHACSVPR